jgi:serine/threonine protein kinase
MCASNNISKEYSIQKKSIGTGSFCKVYKGYNNRTNEFVAIKKIDIQELIQKNPMYADNIDKLKEKIDNEIKIVSQLDHINIAKCYKVITKNLENWQNSKIFIIMEFCDGGTLFNYKKTNKMDYKMFMKEIIDGVNYLSLKGIIHRDLKPDNIMVKDHHIKLIDFGFAREYEDELQMFTTICGTPLYVAPEVFSNKEYTINADMWSLGIIFYELIFNVYPFLYNDGYPKNMNILTKVIQINNVNYDISENPNINGNCIDLLQNMIQPNPNKRFNLKNVLSHPYFNLNICKEEIKVYEKNSELSEMLKLVEKKEIDLAEQLAFSDSSLEEQLGKAESAKQLGKAESAKQLGKAESAKQLGKAESAKQLGNAESAKQLGKAESAKQLGNAESVSSNKLIDGIGSVIPLYEHYMEEKYLKINKPIELDELDEFDEDYLKISKPIKITEPINIPQKTKKRSMVYSFISTSIEYIKSFTP